MTCERRSTKVVRLKLTIVSGKAYVQATGAFYKTGPTYTMAKAIDMAELYRTRTRDFIVATANNKSGYGVYAVAWEMAVQNSKRR